MDGRESLQSQLCLRKVSHVAPVTVWYDNIEPAWPPRGANLPNLELSLTAESTIPSAPDAE